MKMMDVFSSLKGVGGTGGNGGGGGDGDEKNRIFHDFLGITASSPAVGPPAAPLARGRDGITKAASEAEPTTSASAASLGASSGGYGTSDLGSESRDFPQWRFRNFNLFSSFRDSTRATEPDNSRLPKERHGVNSSEVFHFHGRKNSTSRPEYLSGRKRNYSDMEYSGLNKENKVLQVGRDPLEKSHFCKTFGKESFSERLGRSRDNELLFPPQMTLKPGSATPHHPLEIMSDSPMPRREPCVPVNPSSTVPKPSHFAHSGIYLEKTSPLHAQKDASAGATAISLSASDEGSRTGIKGCGVVTGTNLSNESGDKSSIVVLPNANGGKNVEQEAYKTPRCHITPSVGRQMTIFFAGQAHVFDDVHPDKADIIMALAGSSGGSWTTTYAATSAERPVTNEANEVPSRQEKEHTSNYSVTASDNTCSLRSGDRRSAEAVRDARTMIQAAAKPQTEAHDDRGPT